MDSLVRSKTAASTEPNHASDRETPRNESQLRLIPGISPGTSRATQFRATLCLTHHSMGVAQGFGLERLRYRWRRYKMRRNLRAVRMEDARRRDDERTYH